MKRSGIVQDPFGSRDHRTYKTWVKDSSKNLVTTSDNEL